ncbi:bifunctional diaminohydroxyphosphoribosylaminopyrimidine deaminase/5-amino-6-(5-phosphoribosylamino)uracil reductase RibD [Francisellaceae bacterium]|nr:bifunctional diaminohydroxyphosphoribosylaminopyrimidine deaminase/5-amino-6-(5-phosphoribosylamino)uracil reductase RibD [Francisellaceae bacterium]
MFSEYDTAMMQKALSLAQKGCFSTKPNPMVGCVITRDNQILGQGYHVRAGMTHAEVNAVNDALKNGHELEGATAYVTLEPCCHTGKTPPCADLLIKHKIHRVVVGSLDCNPIVAGKGVMLLKQAGLSVEVGCLEDSCFQLNQEFFKRMKDDLPYVRLKLAMSLDGRTAMHNGESKWITAEKSRFDVHTLRAKSGAIITGVGTVLADDPALTARLEDGFLGGEKFTQPLKVILDSFLRIPLSAKIFNDPGSVLVCCSKNAKEALKTSLCEKGIEVYAAPEVAGQLDLKFILGLLAEKEINDVMVECGSTLAGSFIEAELVDEIWVYIAPILMGAAARPLMGFELEKMADKYCFEFGEVTQLGCDLRIIGKNFKKKYKENK